MNKSIEKINEFYKVQKDYSYLKSINISRDIHNEGFSLYSLNINLSNSHCTEDSKVLIITFLNIRDIKIGNLEGILNLEFNITDISQDQLEDLNYKVKEEEYEMFSFLCESFDFEVR